MCYDKYKEITILIRKGKDVENILLKKAWSLIDEYHEKEFDCGWKHDSPEHVPLAYTTVSDYDIPIFVYADLVNYKILRLLNNKVFDERVYESLEDLIYFELQDLDFDDLTYVSEEDLDLEDLQ